VLNLKPLSGLNLSTARSSPLLPSCTYSEKLRDPCPVGNFFARKGTNLRLDSINVSLAKIAPAKLPSSKEFLSSALKYFSPDGVRRGSLPELNTTNSSSEVTSPKK